ncbi:hypothetical protein [Oceaniglobus trochenteri]|uniref:hypothetical protein n=1 Tax=Oceaniglobus trochenteri TaxID=2763260 RepID=UPI001CFF88E4|nr:hypothetical protein [Oceaniglobus trochenteri]
MSAPETDLEKQKKRHRPSLFGMGGVVGFAVILLLIWVGWIVMNGNEPEGADVQIDGRTGAVEGTESGTPATSN